MRPAGNTNILYYCYYLLCLFVVYCASEVVFVLVIERPDVVAEALELRDDQVVPEDLGDERWVRRQHVLELRAVQGHGLQRLLGLGLGRGDPAHDFGQAPVRLGADARAADAVEEGARARAPVLVHADGPQHRLELGAGK